MPSCGAYCRRQNSSSGRPSLAASSLRCGGAGSRTGVSSGAGERGTCHTGGADISASQHLSISWHARGTPSAPCATGGEVSSPPGAAPGPAGTAPGAWRRPTPAPACSRSPSPQCWSARCGTQGRGGCSGVASWCDGGLAAGSRGKQVGWGVDNRGLKLPPAPALSGGEHASLAPRASSAQLASEHKH